MVHKNGLPIIMGHDGLHSISSIMKSTGTYILLAIIRTSFILPKCFLIVEFAKCKLRELSSILGKHSTSHRDFGIVETLAPKSHKALHS